MSKRYIYNSRNADKFIVRFPENMRHDIRGMAKSQHIPMNAYIIQRLETALLADMEGTAAVDLPPEQWTPVKGMLVQSRDAMDKVIPWEITGFDFIHNQVYVELVDMVTGAPMQVTLDRVKPYLV